MPVRAKPISLLHRALGLADEYELIVLVRSICNTHCTIWKIVVKQSHRSIQAG